MDKSKVISVNGRRCPKCWGSGYVDKDGSTMSYKCVCNLCKGHGVVDLSAPFVVNADDWRALLKEK